MYLKYGEEELNYLKNRDFKLGKVIDKIGFITQKLDNDLFSSIIHKIIGQQISLNAQRTIWNRFIELVGDVNCNKVLEFKREELQKIGISFRKVDYIFNFATKVKNNEFNIENLNKLSDDEVIKKLTSLDGIGKWTAEMIMIFSMGRKNIFSFGDLGILRGLKNLYGYNEISKDILEKHKSLYSPFGTIASMYLWKISMEENTENLIEDTKNYAVYPFNFGYIKINYKNNEVISLNKLEKFKDFGDKTEFTEIVYKEIMEYLKGERKKFTFSYKLEGTKFQIKVWEELNKIPYGETKSYKEIAIAIGNPKGYRAVAMANNKNPMMIVIPCHRVIGSNGKMVGYRGGVNMKKYLIEMENKYK